MLNSRHLVVFFLLLATNLWANEECCESDCAVYDCTVVGPCACDRSCNYHSDYYHTTGYWATCDNDCNWANANGLDGVWLPEGPPLFRPFIADPHQLTYSAGWRWNDQAITKNVIPVSFYDTFPVYRYCNVWPWGGQMQFDIEGAVWACFDPVSESAPLINADYYCAIPVTYAIDCWSFRLRFYHISSHLGDEFLLDHPGFDRRNPSAEYVDFFVSNQLTREIRLYGGMGYIMHQDCSFERSRYYAEAGAEVRILRLGFISKRQKLYGAPFYAMHWRYTPDFKNHVDMTYALGYEFGKLCGLGRKVRLQLEYHDGYSVEGQFSKQTSNYLEIKGTYGF